MRRGKSKRNFDIAIREFIDFPLKSDLTNDILCNDNSTKDSFSLLYSIYKKSLHLIRIISILYRTHFIGISV